MLNKKAIAAFAAGATLLAGMAFAAPVVATAPAFAETHAAAPKTHAKDVQKKIDEVNKKIEAAKKDIEAKEAAAKAAFTDKAKKAVDKDGKLIDTDNYERAQGGTITKKNGAQGDDAVVAANNYLEKLTDVFDAKQKKDALVLEKAALEEQLNNTVEAKVAADKKALDESAKKLAELKKKVDAAFPQYAKDTNAQKKAAQDLKSVNADFTAFKTKTPDDQKSSKEYKSELKRFKTLVKNATAAEAKAANALTKSTAAFNKAKGDYNAELDDKYTPAYNDLKENDAVAAADYAAPSFLALDMEVTYNTDYFDESAPSEKGKGGHKNDHKQNKQNSKDKGKNGVHINTKGRKGKKQLGKTGVGVAFAALAAAMLAGMGAAVRKIRH